MIFKMVRFITPIYITPHIPMKSSFKKVFELEIAKSLLLLVFLLTANVTYSQPQQGAIDPTFNPLDLGAADGGANGIVRAVILQPDGKIIIAGDFTIFRGATRNKIARVNSDGALDTSLVSIVS